MPKYRRISDLEFIALIAMLMALVFFEEGKELSIPLEWFPKLRNASIAQLKKWRFIGNGERIHWKELDEDICFEKLLE